MRTPEINYANIKKWQEKSKNGNSSTRKSKPIRHADACLPAGRNVSILKDPETPPEADAPLAQSSA